MQGNKDDDPQGVSLACGLVQQNVRKEKNHLLFFFVFLYFNSTYKDVEAITLRPSEFQTLITSL